MLRLASREHVKIQVANVQPPEKDSIAVDRKKPTPPPGAPNDGSRRPPPANRRPPPGRENMPPPGRRAPPGPNHRPTRSQEEALRARKMQGKGPLDEKRSPSRRRDPRPRRNSESSILDIEKPLTEEEKKAKEERRRERERKYRESKDKKPTNRKLDIIDQLDATSIYGTGRTQRPMFPFSPPSPSFCPPLPLLSLYPHLALETC